VRFDGQWKFGRVKRRHRQKRGRICQRTALQVRLLVMEQGPMAIFSKCMSTLPLVGSILRRGEDERDVKNGMTSFTNCKSFWRGRGRGRGRSRWLSPLLVVFMHKVNIFRAKAEVRVLWLQRLLVGNVAICRG
jgi:hypothetical protein